MNWKKMVHFVDRARLEFNIYCTPSVKPNPSTVIKNIDNKIPVHKYYHTIYNFSI